ncbi:MAG: 30S ribosomal protein S6 [Christensenellales bacterium]
MNQYEVLYIINDTLDEAGKKALVERFSKLVTDNGGTVDSIDEWGTRKLAYPIEDMESGYYVLMNFQSAPEFPAELERNMRILAENVLRFMVTRKGE